MFVFLCCVERFWIECWCPLLHFWRRWTCHWGAKKMGKIRPFDGMFFPIFLWIEGKWFKLWAKYRKIMEEPWRHKSWVLNFSGLDLWHLILTLHVSGQIMRMMQLGSELLAPRQKKTTKIRKGLKKGTSVAKIHEKSWLLAVSLYSHTQRKPLTVYKLYIKQSALGVKPK